MKIQNFLFLCAAPLFCGSVRLKALFRNRRTFPCVLATLLSAVPVWPQQNINDISTQSLEDLMNIEVTSASKKAETLSGAPAAIFVITAEDILRGGFSSIPDALRTVPGLHVAQQDSHLWIVAARGFSGIFNRDMLVLIDGRLVYTPLTGGVWWDVQDPPLEDIDRIEVIRGPGGTLWGANAVNGVINIITKTADNTQGALVSTTAGVNEGYGARLRYGGKLWDQMAYRIYGTSNSWLPTVNANGANSYDSWNLSQGGIRLDWKSSPKNTLTFDGQGYSGRTRDLIATFSPTAPPVELTTSAVVKGGHLLGRWTHRFNDQSSTDLLGYCDWTNRNTEGFIEPRNTCDVEFQHNYAVTDRQSLTWGGQIITTSATEQNDFTTRFVPLSERDTISSVFLQYELDFLSDKLRVIGGSKFEHNSDTGFEYEPQIRAVWNPIKSHNIWVAISRAIRTPTTAERSLVAPIAELTTAPPTFLVLTGNQDAGTERMHAFEAGYRYEWKSRFSFDGALYYNAYYDLIGNKPGPPIINPDPFYVDIPLVFSNLGSGQTHGLELYFQYTPFRRWTLATGITELRGNSVAGLVVSPTGADPRHQISVQSKLDLTAHLNLDARYYYYDAIPPSLPPVNRVDLGASTKSLRGFTFSVWGRNLQADHHQEVTPFILPAGEIRRSVIFKLVWESPSDQAKRAH
jgi:iron complex outermembrane receptor protein